MGLLGLLLPVALAGTHGPGVAIVPLTGLDCAGCVPEIEEALNKVGGVAAARASFTQALACVVLDKPVDETALTTAVARAGFGTGPMQTVDACPDGAKPGAPRSLWNEAGTLDVVIVSHGEDVELPAILAPGKTTIVDFGAPWCGPCVTGAARILEHLEERPDVAVRAIELPGRDATASFASPAAEHHLKFASALPYFVVFGPDAKELYRGSDVKKALAATGPAPAP